LSESGYPGFKDLQDDDKINTALPGVMRYKKPTPNPHLASNEGAMMYII
jgi:hypothetical protein